MALDNDRLTTQPRSAIPYSGDWVDQTWHAQAACKDSGEDMISPESPGLLIYQYCRTCPVRLECALDGLTMEAERGFQITGIWGGVYIPHHSSRRNGPIRALAEECAILRRNAAVA